MSASPFLTPGQGPRRGPSAARQLRRWAAAAAAVLVLALAAALLVIAVAHSAHRSPRAATRRPSHDTPVTSVPPVAFSPDGLPLGKPALALPGLVSPAEDPVHLAFHHAPRAGLLFNLSTGQVLWQRNPYARLPIASLTKMMTALLTVSSAPPGAPVLVTRQAVASGGSKVGVLPLGRHVRLESLLYGLLLPSGNDAAVALAQHLAGTVKRFVAEMNAEAAKLGMGCTRFSSPSGYYDRGNFSCAADLALLAHVDLQQRRIARVTRTYNVALPFPIKGGKLYLSNNNPLLVYGYPGTTGLKTGYTVAAGRCLVATAERHGVRLGVVLLHSPAPATEARHLLDYAFERVYGLRSVPEPAMPPQA